MTAMRACVLLACAVKEPTTTTLCRFPTPCRAVLLQVESGAQGAPSALQPQPSDGTMPGWVAVATRECVLLPLRCAPSAVQQAFVAAVAAMPDNELVSQTGGRRGVGVRSGLARAGGCASGGARRRIPPQGWQ